MAICIPPTQVNEIIKALQSGEISIPALFEMKSSEERRAVWEKHVGKDLAKFINTKVEHAMASQSKTAMQDVIAELVGPQEQVKTKTDNILDKIQKLKDKDLLDIDAKKGVFTDLVSDALGVSVSPAELKTISEKADNIKALNETLQAEEARQRPKETAAAWRKRIQGPTIEYNAALTDMDKFMNGLTPTHKLAVLTGSIFRGNMLLNLAPATVNFISNLVQGTVQAMERRIAVRTLAGSNNDYALEYGKMVMQVFKETGRDISRNYGEDIRLGEQLVHNEGPGILRKTARGQAKIVFKYLLGYSDVASAAFANADSTNVASARLARHKDKTWTDKQVKSYAQAVFKESVKSTQDTTTDIGVDAFFIRTEAIADAERATWTNKGFISERALQLRNWLNDTTGDLQLGFWNIPFVKTGANVIQFGIESSPIGLIAGGAQLAKLKLRKNKLATSPDELRNIIRLMVRGGLGTLLTTMLVGLIDPDDFFSAYDSITQSQRDQMGLKKGVYNAVKIGDKWVSLDFFGPLGATMVGMMYAKKYGDGPVEKTFKFAQGVGQQTLQVPGIDNFEDLIDSWKDILTADTLGEAGKGASASAINTIRSRAIPGIVGTFAKGLDKKVRKIDRKNLLDGIKAQIPLLRETLPAKVDITTGKEIEGEGLITNLLFGSRVKTAKESRLIDEISRLESEGESPAIADIERSSKQVQGLHSQIGDKRFQSALKFFGQQYGRQATRLVASVAYRRASDEDKKKMLNNIRTKVRTDMLERFNFRKPLKGRRK